MCDNVKAIILRHLKADKLVPVIVTALISLVVATVAGYCWEKLTAPLSNIATQVNTGLTAKGELHVQAQAVERQTIRHRFLFFGHVHYVTTYQIEITNRTVGPHDTATLQLSSRQGRFVTFTAPPLVKPTLVDGTPATIWARKLDGDKPRQLGVDFEVPPQGVRVTFLAVVSRTGAFVPDQDLRIHLKCGNTFVEREAAAVRWAEKTR